MPYIGNTSQKFVTADDVTVTDDLTVTDDATIGGALSAKGGAVFNEDSADVDFRVESNGNANMLFVDGGNDKVGIGTTSPNAKLSVSGTGTVDLGIGSTNAGGAYLYLDGDSNGDFSGSDYSYIGHDTSGQLLIHQDSPSGSDNMIFSTNATERMRIESGGDIAVKTGDIYFSTAGKGIVLGATSNTDANTLHDYEEGAVTLTMQGGNGNPSSTQTLSGQYTKVGNMVSFRAQNENINNTGASGSIQFTGLPFASSGAYGIGTLAWNDLATITGIPYTFVSGNIAYIYENRSEADTIAVNHHVDTAGRFYISCVYQTNA